MGHVKPKRTTCFVTADGTVHKSLKEAQLHVNRIAEKLAWSKRQLKAAVQQQKENKKNLKETIGQHKQRLINGWGTPQLYVSWGQANVAKHASHISYLERNVEGYKRLLRGE